jgi:FixJ family two-component response regulator
VSYNAPTLFVVDDDPSVRAALSLLLRSTGYNVETFASADDLLARRPFDGPGCILLDVQMPGLNGLDLQQVLSVTDRPLPIIFITGHGNIPMSVRAMKAGAVDFLTKPFDDEELLNAVARALSKSKIEQLKRNEVAEISGRLSTLTAREQEVFGRVVAGQLNKQIAADLGTVEKTIKVHRARVMQKMCADSLAELVMMAARAGIFIQSQAQKVPADDWVPHKSPSGLSFQKLQESYISELNLNSEAASPNGRCSPTRP